MANISSAGIGSGLDIEGLVSQLIAAERQPAQNRLDRREARLQAELSAYGAFKGALSAFQSALSGLTTADAFQSIRASSSDRDVLTASASKSAAAGSYNVDIANLASAHSLASTPFDNTTDPIGSGASATGTLTFRFGTTDYDAGTGTYNGFTQNSEKAVQTVTIDSTNNSLEGIRDAVNEADIGVSASIINDGNGYRLVFVSTDTGAANSLEISVSEGDGGNDTDTTGLSKLAFNISAANLEQTQAAQDASLTINGLAVTSATNTVKDAIEGVTLELVEAGTATLKVTQDTGAASRAVDSFISGYNGLIETVNQLSGYDAATRRGGILLGDATLRGITSRIRSALAETVDGLTGKYTSLAAIGIETDSKTGKLSKNSDVFDDVLENNFDRIARLFAVTAETSDALIRYEGADSDTQVGDYAVEITQLATRGELTGGTNIAGAPGAIVIAAGSNDTFTIDVDGVSSGTITLTAGTYTGDQLAAELQARINGDSNFQDNDVSVTVSFDTDHFVITSARYGSASKVESMSGTAATALDLAGGTSTDGVDVAGTIGGAAATGSGRFLTGTGDAEGLKIEVMGGATGSRGTVDFTRGLADTLSTLLEAFLDEDDNALDARTEGIQARIDDITDQREQLSRRMAKLEERYRAQFTALDSLVSQLQTTSDFLTQQLANLPGAYKPKQS